MMKHEDMITLIGNLYINAYIAGDRKDLDSFISTRADRDRIFDAIRDLYAELEMESYRAEQNGVELKKAKEEIIRLTEEIKRRIEEKKAIFNGHPCPGMKTRLSEIYGSMLTDPDNPDSPLWSDYAPTDDVPDDVPDDGNEFSEQDLPFPDVDVMAPAEEVEGGEE